MVGKSLLKRAIADMQYPAEFDPVHYRGSYPELESLSEDELANHFQTIGIPEGRWGSPHAGRFSFLDIIPKDGDILEIGPGSNPVMRGEQVRYFDVLSTEGLKARSEFFSENVSSTPDLDYSSPVGDLRVIDRKFPTIVSSHCIEHQPDLVRHLRDVEHLLEPGGAYYVLAPDKRFTGDHYIPLSTIGEVVEAHAMKRTFHSAANVVDVEAMYTHNDGKRHWDGDHGPVPEPYSAARIKAALEKCQSSEDYVDVHAWFWTADTFRALINTIADLGWTSLRPVRVYQPPYPANEFCAILTRV